MTIESVNLKIVYDELLVLRWQNGEAAAMNELVDRWHARLFRHVRRLANSADDASDIMQETWLAMIRSVPKLDDPAKFPAWAYRIASNKAADFVRKKSRHPTVPLDKPDEIVAQSTATEVTEPNNLHDLLNGLSVEHRTVVSLRYGEDLPLETIAGMLNIPLGTVKSRLHYALDFLKQKNNTK
ncbi:MAG: RNA polymerase sigma factor [Planctomycetaceae bacterium]|jgi:RNA polymerase sigma-70 factor (ECF subfamily)|nr:RNA polymerase sigma factor [Planctomycetaceae bacterium]